MSASSPPTHSDGGEGVAISVRGLSKVFRLYHRPADLMMEVLTGRARHTERRALGDVSFEIARGEVVGIVGRNGAGKSTLLKILAGTLDKTAGQVTVNGSIAAILELGAGFHPEYTGRENILVGGLCLGMSRAEIARKTDSIIAFSELGEVIDQPFRTYSTGMQARLTFATAISVEPDILIIDEALAVGDLLFQEKCYTRIRETARGGATVLFVTHSLNTIYELCTRGILLDRGRVAAIDNPRKIGYAYEHRLAEERARNRKVSVLPQTHIGPTGKENAERNVEIERIQILDSKNQETHVLRGGESYCIRVRCRSRVSLENISLSFRIQKGAGGVLYGTTTELLGRRIDVQAGETVDADFQWECNLAEGQYLLGGGVAQALPHGDYVVIHILRDAWIFSVETSARFQGDFNMQSEVIIHHHVLSSNVETERDRPGFS
jgi:ABC-type polysaccharide/polyol phosphate transport system ATPase subunit